LNPKPMAQGSRSTALTPKVTLFHFEMSPKYDGKDYPMTGNSDPDMISMKKIDDYTIETVGKKGGESIMTVRSVVSKDGKIRTSTQKGTNAKGQKVNNTLVYTTRSKRFRHKQIIWRVGTWQRSFDAGT
jgi:hypothetical protein